MWRPSRELLKRARTAHQAGELDKARRLYGWTLAFDRRCYFARAGLAHLAAARGDWPEAIRTALAALELDPSDPRLHLILIEASAESADASVRQRLDALVWSQAPPKAFLPLAQTYLETGDRARGRAWLERHLATGSEPGPEGVADLRVLAADPEPDGAVLRVVTEPLQRKGLASPAFFARFADAGRCDLLQALPRLPGEGDPGWIYPVYFGSARPFNPKARGEKWGFRPDRIPGVVDAMREGRAVLVLDHGHEALFANALSGSPAPPPGDLLAFAAYLKAEAIPARQVLILDGNPKSPQLAAEAFRMAGVEGLPVLADRFLWLEAAGMFRRIAEAEGGAAARLARAEAAMDRSPDKAFLSFNHAPRPHRTALVAFLLEQGLLDRGLVSFRGPDYRRERTGRALEDAEWAESALRQIAPLVDLTQPEETIAALLARAPLQVDVDYGPTADPKTMAARANASWPYEASCVSIVTETAFSNGNSSHVTEKVIKPIGNLHPFVYVGEPGVLSELRDLGFRTFSPMIDERYDEIMDPAARMAALLPEIHRLASMTPQELDAFRRACWPAVRHNYEQLLAVAPIEAERIARRIGAAVEAALGGGVAPVPRSAAAT